MFFGFTGWIVFQPTKKISDGRAGESPSKKKLLPACPLLKRLGEPPTETVRVSTRERILALLIAQSRQIPFGYTLVTQLGQNAERSIPLPGPVPREHLRIAVIALISLALAILDDVNDQFIRETCPDQFLPELSLAVLSPCQVSKAGGFDSLPGLDLRYQSSPSASRS